MCVCVCVLSRVGKGQLLRANLSLLDVAGGVGSFVVYVKLLIISNLALVTVAKVVETVYPCVENTQ